jgi:hypothetical protein
MKRVKPTYIEREAGITCMLKGWNIYSYLNVKNSSGNVHINVKLRCIHETIVAVGKQYYINRVCLYP